MTWNVVDSSGWLEYISSGPNAEFFAPILQDKVHLLVPAVSYFEVVKVLQARLGESAVREVIAQMNQATPVPLAPELAVVAARLAVRTGLPMGDALIAATAEAFGATLWTQDNDFRGLPYVKFKSKS